MNIEELRQFCLSLPNTEEDIKWGKDLCFTIGKKMFCVTGLDNETFGLSLKVTPEDFNKLTTLEGVSPAPYLARYKWISVKGENRFSIEEWKHYITRSYELVKSKLPKKLLKE